MVGDVRSGASVAIAPDGPTVPLGAPAPLRFAGRGRFAGRPVEDRRVPAAVRSAPDLAGTPMTTPTRERLLTLFERTLAERMRSIEPAAAADVYAVSFYVRAVDDDPRLAGISVGFNTESRAAGQHASAGEEARWNYAFWLQNVVCELPAPDGPQAEAWRALLAERSLDFTDRQWDEDPEAVDGLQLGIAVAAVDLAIDLSLRWHASATSTAVFGRTVPVIVHELEYYDTVAAVTEAANPPGVADEFLSWVNPDFPSSDDRRRYPGPIPHDERFFL